MSAAAETAAHFRRRGFFFIANPFGAERMATDVANILAEVTV